MELLHDRSINRRIAAAGFLLLVIVGASSAVAGTCAEEISIVQTAIDRAEHDTAAASGDEQAAAIRAGVMRKSTGDASDVFDSLTENIATSGADAARQSAGKPTIFQHAAHLKAARMAKADKALARARACDTANVDNGCRAAVTDARRALLAR